MRIQEASKVLAISEVASNIFLLDFSSPSIARSAKPGQFVNLKIDGAYSPLLRRPMSICDIEEDRVKILFNVVGRGTAMLAEKRVGENIDVLGPLGRGFDVSRKCDLAIIVAGGLGVAPFPLLTRVLSRVNVRILTFLGARTRNELVTAGLKNLSVSTDDGTSGFQGTVIELLRRDGSSLNAESPVIFGCGPTEMLRGLQQFSRDSQIACEVSLETPMACGIGICQGCPVEMTEGESKYKLACKDGPVFDTSKISI